MSVDLKLDALGKALQRFHESLQYEESHPLVIDASIQRFEFSIELSWKTLKACLAQEGITANTPRECMQRAYSAHWFDDEKAWLSMLKDRNLTSHTYKEDLALEIYRRLPGHYQAMKALHAFLTNHFYP
ncbi:HI0074 family nucleotidyltransferase substrate-binding subunit [Endozoicomonas sp. 8E]|uniref:HI0074 family nucleotidyltransferase substrate-binding subunit n=1 Tax=Endozoicomonas sp. 8E TaxID=3035692 RepID=UPI0029394EFC|nr:HI0074 family nucleotidyltransferase substrate-binding subunit [Endozoicomonas sp. 8E]WOG27183.1 HI0074 family nucleotidyltransferase substrate-binding subunit [Endozoicomonas sp. 8E]